VGTFREIEWAPKAEKEYASWDDKGRLRIDELIKSIWEHGPLKGAGLPERLKYDLSGWFWRRIIGEHRLGLSNHWRGRRGGPTDRAVHVPLRSPLKPADANNCLKPKFAGTS
jgi:toxin YoeB